MSSNKIGRLGRGLVFDQEIARAQRDQANKGPSRLGGSEGDGLEGSGCLSRSLSEAGEYVRGGEGQMALGSWIEARRKLERREERDTNHFLHAVTLNSGI